MPKGAKLAPFHPHLGSIFCLPLPPHSKKILLGLSVKNLQYLKLFENKEKSVKSSALSKHHHADEAQ